MSETGSEAPIKTEAVEATHAADQHLSNRRQVLNERLLGWGKLYVGGIGAQIAAVAAFPISPPLGIALGLGGAVSEFVGFLGIVGNVVKRISKNNR